MDDSYDFDDGDESDDTSKHDTDNEDVMPFSLRNVKSALDHQLSGRYWNAVSEDTRSRLTQQYYREEW